LVLNTIRATKSSKDAVVFQRFLNRERSNIEIAVPVTALQRELPNREGSRGFKDLAHAGIERGRSRFPGHALDHNDFGIETIQDPASFVGRGDVGGGRTFGPGISGFYSWSVEHTPKI
jgi:hypothetical protein